MNASEHRYFMVHKPFNMTSQFVSPHQVRLLGDLDFEFPEGTHAIGRLDNDSEGLLLLTTHKKITKLLFESNIAHSRSYLVNVQNQVSPETVARLEQGISIRIKGGEYYITRPCQVRRISDPENEFPQHIPHLETIPNSWLHITLTEGKYHQIRKMVAAVGHRCRRLIRISIEEMELGTLAPGQVREFSEAEFFSLLHLAREPIDYPGR